MPREFYSFTITCMHNERILGRDFFAQPALKVARSLLGMQLVRVDKSVRISGTIIETEAYCGEQDLGCHCRAGKTPRTEVMYGPPGHAYVYFTYGMHWMLNFVVEREGFPAAILIRGIKPEEGIQVISKRRGNQPKARWTNGPGKICQALNIDGELNGADLCAEDARLFVETGKLFPDSCVNTGPRVGLNSVPEPWKSIPWRFLVSQPVSLEQKD
ncbi:MAG: DNA-3-methyladenine glycosylase [Anaerolineales bacterium]